MATRLVLVRHGETEWTKSGQHTGCTDIPLTDRGREDAFRLRDRLQGWTFARVLSSPLSRALETARLAGFGDRVETADELREWDYGAYEGRTTADIRTRRRRWSLWLDGTPEGESAADVGARVDRLLKELRDVDGDVAVFAHGHVLRVLTARWLGLSPVEGRLFALAPATISLLGYERETPVIRLWNSPCAEPA
ncbi:MAG: histidine phosphatase family protein [Actinomycetota bacterium]|nr:histidine phosphatase family protein [Actinomycetota bacterium]